MIGRTLDHYQIDSKLGEGGMGVVYGARDTHLNRSVAIKFLPPDRVADPSRKERFTHEARTASALNHPNIVTIYDIRSLDGVDFIVMESIDGETLEKMIPPNGMRVTQALKVAVQIADAVASAHQAGILHRDIKPANVMVTREGRAKVLDFGLAKLSEPAELLSNDPTFRLGVTSEGAVVGTAAYMSPEQAEGRQLDFRSDIFSFGSVLYEMVTGQRPFPANSLVGILSKIVNNDPVPPRQLGILIPPELEKAILRCLRKDPARRYQTMADLKVALEDLEAEPTPRWGLEVEATPGRSLGRGWMWAVLVPLIGGAAFFAIQAWRPPRSSEPPQAVALTTFPGIENYPSFSPEGNQVAFTWDGPKRDNADIYVQQVGAGSPLRLTTDSRSDLNPVWSPDGRWIAFLRGELSGPISWSTRELVLIPPLGGPERKLAEIRMRQMTDSLYQIHLAWCPDSSCLIATDSSGEGKPDALFRVSLETGEKTQLTKPPAAAVGDLNPAISPDGRTLVFERALSYAFSELHKASLGKDWTVGEAKQLTTTAMGAEYPTWMPGNRQILYSAKGSLWNLDVFEDDSPERVAFVGEDGLMPAVSLQKDQSVRLVYARSSTDENIWRIDASAPGARSSAAPVLAVASTRLDAHPRVSPDGRRVAFASTRSGEWQIWVADPDGNNAVQLTSMESSATGGPRWSPDGQRIAFASNQGGEFNIYGIPAGGGRPNPLTDHPKFDHAPHFSRDGKWIYFVSDRTGRYEIWRMTAAGKEPSQITSEGGWGALEAPDGASIYYLDVPVEGATLWNLSVDKANQKPTKVLTGVVWWNYDVIQKGIYYIDRTEGGEARLRFFDFTTRSSTTTAENLGNVRCCLNSSADGRTVLFVREDSSIHDLMLVEKFR